MKNFMSNNKIRFRLLLIILAVVLALTVATGFLVRFFFGRSGDDAGLDSLIPEKLAVGESFTLDDVVEEMGYEPYWISTDAISVTVFTAISDGDGPVLEEGEHIISYDSSSRTFSVGGYGEGIVEIKSTLDETVRIVLDYRTHFHSEDTLAIIESN